MDVSAILAGRARSSATKGSSSVKAGHRTAAAARVAADILGTTQTILLSENAASSSVEAALAASARASHPSLAASDAAVSQSACIVSTPLLPLQSFHHATALVTHLTRDLNACSDDSPLVRVGSMRRISVATLDFDATADASHVEFRFKSEEEVLHSSSCPGRCEVVWDGTPFPTRTREECALLHDAAPALVKPIVKRFADPVEVVRVAALRMVSALSTHVLDVTLLLPYALPGLCHTLRNACVYDVSTHTFHASGEEHDAHARGRVSHASRPFSCSEGSEEVRLESARCMMHLILAVERGAGGALLRAYAHEVWMALHTLCHDAAARVACCACAAVRALVRVSAGDEALKAIMNVFTPGLLRSLASLMTRTHAGTRVAVMHTLTHVVRGDMHVDALADALTHVCGGAATSIPIAAFYTHTHSVNMLASASVDASVGVRVATARFCAAIAASTDPYMHTRIMPYILTLCADDAPVVSAAAMGTLEELAAAWEATDGREATLKRLQSGVDGDPCIAYARPCPSPFLTRARMAVRLYVRGHVHTWIQTLCRDIGTYTHWGSSRTADAGEAGDTHLRAMRVLCLTLAACEETATVHANELFPALRTLVERNPQSTSRAYSVAHVCARLTGRFVSPHVWLPTIAYTPADANLCAWALCEAPVEWVRGVAPVIVRAMCSPDALTSFALSPSGSPALAYLGAFNALHACLRAEPRLRVVCVGTGVATGDEGAAAAAAGEEGLPMLALQLLRTCVAVRAHMALRARLHGELYWPTTTASTLYNPDAPMDSTAAVVTQGGAGHVCDAVLDLLCASGAAAGSALAHADATTGTAECLCAYPRVASCLAARALECIGEDVAVDVAWSQYSTPCACMTTCMRDCVLAHMSPAVVSRVMTIAVARGHALSTTLDDAHLHAAAVTTLNLAGRACTPASRVCINACGGSCVCPQLHGCVQLLDAVQVCAAPVTRAMCVWERGMLWWMDVMRASAAAAPPDSSMVLCGILHAVNDAAGHSCVSSRELMQASAQLLTAYVDAESNGACAATAGALVANVVGRMTSPAALVAARTHAHTRAYTHTYRNALQLMHACVRCLLLPAQACTKCGTSVESGQLLTTLAHVLSYAIVLADVVRTDGHAGDASSYMSSNFAELVACIDALVHRCSEASVPVNLRAWTCVSLAACAGVYGCVVSDTVSATPTHGDVLLGCAQRMCAPAAAAHVSRMCVRVVEGWGAAAAAAAAATATEVEEDAVRPSWLQWCGDAVGMLQEHADMLTLLRPGGEEPEVGGGME